MLLGVGEGVELDAGVGVGEAEALERGEDVAAGRFRGSSFGQEPWEFVAVRRARDGFALRSVRRSAVRSRRCSRGRRRGRRYAGRSAGL